MNAEDLCFVRRTIRTGDEVHVEGVVAPLPGLPDLHFLVSSLRKTGAVPKDRVVVPWRNVVPEKPRKPEAEARALAEPAGAGDGDAGRVCRQWAYYDTCTNKNC
eukprot:EG_transcript_54717